MSDPRDDRIKAWVDAETAPEAAGWYATLSCWDPAEGFFPGSFQWDGKQWRDCRPALFTHRSPQPFATHKEAHKWAYDNDPEW